MPLTGLANAAIDRIAPDPLAFAATLSRYAESDLLCYRADAPEELVAREAAAWDPLLAWAQARYDVHFAIATGVIHVAQPPATLARLAGVVAARDAFALAGLSPLVTTTGSLSRGWRWPKAPSRRIMCGRRRRSKRHGRPNAGVSMPRPNAPAPYDGAISMRARPSSPRSDAAVLQAVFLQ